MADTSRLEFTMSYSDLITTCNTIHTFMVRDAAEFLANFGVTALMIAAFDTKINEFESFPTDEVLQGLAQQTTQDKDIIANNVRIKIRSIAVRAKNVFGENSGSYSAFGVKDMNRFDDGNLLACGRRVAQMGETYLTQLAAEGLTQNMLDDLLDICNEFETAGKAQKLAIANRSDSAKARVNKANELYKLLVKYCDYGKDIWYNINSARYDNYVIYQNISPGSLLAPQNLVFNYSAKVLWWDIVDNAVSYQLQWFNGTDYEEIYAGDADNFAFTPPDGLNKFRVRAHNSGGYGPWSDILDQYYFNTLPKAQNLQVTQNGVIPTEGELTWNLVPTVVSYKVYQSVDNIGEYPAHWLVIATVTEPMKNVNLTLGKRNSFKIESNNTYQTSMSDPIYIEV